MARPDLKAFRELRVSDPTLGRDASTSTYTFVDRKGKAHPIELHYKFPVALYAEPSWAMRNQARVHHAIASLNYGLFCDRVVLGFPLTRDDIDYYRAMQKVTAREQYLTRFARDEPHPLILPKYHVPLEDFEPEAVDDLAEIVVEVERPQGQALRADPERYAVLSSGGKESLLTYGLLRELGEDVTPVYVNESGRHWYTAMTSYRHHVRTEPRTKRIWTSVDRLYVAANRLLPFVRPDFQRAGADVYPTQLFTFNSYQMATAGLCLHEGIGTMLMGNEFDDGAWPEVKGVRYWYGIYDQSQEFDLVLNAYFEKKGWPLVQTSLLRTLSGVLIESLLGERYPELLRTQTSCHATHIENERVIPCGRCSKCLGILLMLAANGIDPKKMRYKANDVKQLVERISTAEVKVEGPEAEHAMWLAAQNGFHFAGTGNGYVPQPHPEIETLRFHPEMSRRDAMPKALGDRVYKLLLTRATGVREKRQETWHESTA